MHHLRNKPESDHTGQESYVAAKIKACDISFFPINKSLALLNAGAMEEDDDGLHQQQKGHSGMARAATRPRIAN